MTRTVTAGVAAAGMALLGLVGCASVPFSQDALPAAVQVASGHRVAFESVGSGTITYECRAKKDASGFEWVFGGPEAKLTDRSGKSIGRYFGPPATWAASDGSIITGAQIAVSPTASGDLPLQLVRANPATGRGVMEGVTFIQRVATKGGAAPASSCEATALGRKEVVRYQADYIFYKASQ